MTYIAKVKRVLRQNIHTVGTSVDGDIKTVATMPLPDRTEIELDGSETQPCMMCRYTHDGQFCGDTWHETLEAAFQQAEYEYGLTRTDFERVDRT